MKEGLDGCDLINRYKKRFLLSLFFRVDFYVTGKGSEVLCLMNIVVQTGICRQHVNFDFWLIFDSYLEKFKGPLTVFTQSASCYDSWGPTYNSCQS